jgi:hypothetical protein
LVIRSIARGNANRKYKLLWNIIPRVIRVIQGAIVVIEPSVMNLLCCIVVLIYFSV